MKIPCRFLAAAIVAQIVTATGTGETLKGKGKSTLADIGRFLKGKQTEQTAPTPAPPAPSATVVVMAPPADGYKYGDQLTVEVTGLNLAIGTRDDEKIEVDMNIFSVADPGDKYTTKRALVTLEQLGDDSHVGSTSFVLNALNVDRPVVPQADGTFTGWIGSWDQNECTTGAGCDDCDCLACFGCDPVAARVEVTIFLSYAEKIKGTTYLRRENLGEFAIETAEGVRDGSACYCDPAVDICNGANGCSKNQNMWYNAQPVSSIYPECMTYNGGDHTNCFRCTYEYHVGTDPRDTGNCPA